MSGAVAAVDVVAAQDRPAELLRREVDLVGRLAAAEGAERRRAVGRLGGLEPVDGPSERFVPRRGSKLAALRVADEGLGQ